MADYYEEPVITESGNRMDVRRSVASAGPPNRAPGSEGTLDVRVPVPIIH